jgi:hypothetical protein
MFMPAPTYQAGLGFASRGVPDLALLAGLPGVGTCSELPGQIDPVEGTSVASPLSAGFLALISSRLGCHTGDPHVALYALGFAEQDGGPAVFNQITSGNNGYGGVPGYDAGPGYNLATGWGSLNVAVMAGAWPGCPVETDGGLFEVDAGTTPSTEGDDAGPAYAQCAFIDCAPADCDTIPEGPLELQPRLRRPRRRQLRHRPDLQQRRHLFERIGRRHRRLRARLHQRQRLPGRRRHAGLRLLRGGLHGPRQQQRANRRWLRQPQRLPHQRDLHHASRLRWWLLHPGLHPRRAARRQRLQLPRWLRLRALRPQRRGQRGVPAGVHRSRRPLRPRGLPLPAPLRRHRRLLAALRAAHLRRRRSAPRHLHRVRRQQHLRLRRRQRLLRRPGRRRRPRRGPDARSPTRARSPPTPAHPRTPAPSHPSTRASLSRPSPRTAAAAPPAPARPRAGCSCWPWCSCGGSAASPEGC